MQLLVKSTHSKEETNKMSSTKQFDNSYKEVIDDKSNEFSTNNYYNQWSNQVGYRDCVNFVDRGDPMANAAGPITDAIESPSTCNYYGKWSNKYETDMKSSNYNGPKHVVNAFVELELDCNLRILDVLAGSGLVAELLRPHGYINIDAIDGSKDMLALAQKKELYKNVYVSLLGGKHQAPIPDETYDVVIASGAFGPGHLYSDVFSDLIRVTKTGGIISWSMRSDYGLTSPRFTNFDDDVEQLIKDGIWRHHIVRQDIDQYLLGSDGYTYTMKKI